MNLKNVFLGCISIMVLETQSGISNKCIEAIEKNSPCFVSMKTFSMLMWEIKNKTIFVYLNKILCPFLNWVKFLNQLVLFIYIFWIQVSYQI